MDASALRESMSTYIADYELVVGSQLTTKTYFRVRLSVSATVDHATWGAMAKHVRERLASRDYSGALGELSTARRDAALNGWNTGEHEAVCQSIEAQVLEHLPQPAAAVVRAREREDDAEVGVRQVRPEVVGQREPEVRLRDEARHEEVVRRVVRGEGELPS